MKKEGSVKFYYSISFKITLVVVTILIFATSIGTYIEYKREKNYSFNDYITQTERIALGVSNAASFLIINNKIPSLQTMVEHTTRNERCSSCHSVMKNESKFLANFKDIPESLLEVFVISEDFRIVASSQNNLNGEKIESFLQNKKWKHEKVFRKIKKAMLNGNFSSGIDDEDLCYEVIVPFKRDKENKDITGLVFVSNDLKRLKQHLFINFLETIAGFVLLSSFIGGCLFVALRKIITEPIRKLTQSAKIFEKGEKSERLCVKKNDELGFLCHTFNEMTENIAQRESELLKHNKMVTSLSEILSVVSISLNLQEILDTSLKKVLVVLEIDAGGIFLFDEPTYSLVLKSSCGLSEEFINAVITLKADDGLVGKAFTTGETIALEEIRNIPRLNIEAVKSEGLKSGAYIPLKSKEDKVLGVMAIGSKYHKKFRQDEITLLGSIGRLIGIGVENGLLYENSKKKAKQIEMANKLGKFISETHNIDEIVQIIAKRIPEVIPSEFGGIHLFDISKKQVDILYFFKDKFVILKKPVIAPIEGTAFEQCITTRKTLLRKDLKEEAQFFGEKIVLERFGVRSMLTNALTSKDEIIGFISIGRQEPNSYREEDAELFEIISREVSVSIHNAKLFENILRAKNEWENTFDSMFDMVSIHDKEFNISRANRFLAFKLNMKPKDLIGKKCYEIFNCGAEFQKNCPHAESMSTGRYCEKEIEGKGFLDGNLFFVSTTPLFDSRGNITGSIHVMKDITQKKAAERKIIESNETLKNTLQRLEITQEQLLQADKLAAVGQLVSGVAHELNNPLTSVIGYSQLLMRKAKEESLKSDAEKVFNEANRAAKIVGNLLTFARQKKPEKTYVDINEAYKNTMRLRAYEMKVSNIAVIEELDPTLPKTMADFNQLQQAFLNIVINSEQVMIEANNGGRLIVKTEVIKTQESDAEKKFIRISFKDNGTGIPRENLKSVFDPFFTTKPVGKGTGLGLSLSYGIVKEHAGKIYAKNNEDKGVTFFIELPVIQGADKHDAVEKIEKANSAGCKKILVVDDEEMIRALLKEALESAGHKVDLAGNGNDAIHKIKRKSYDLIVSDIKMPSLDGKELYNLVKIENPLIAKNIIFITGDTVNPNTISFLEKTGNIFLEKPFQTKNLIKAVEEVLTRNVH